MVLKLFNKIHIFFYKIFNKNIFNQVHCDISTLVIGPEIYTNFNIKHPEKVTIGDGTAINGNCFINAMGTLHIGKYCHIGKGLTVYTHNHNFQSTEWIPYDTQSIVRPVKIGDAVWIGANVTIAPGTTIGHGVIISTGSVVFGEIPDGAIIRGNPATIIKYRDMKAFWKCYKENKFS